MKKQTHYTMRPIEQMRELFTQFAYDAQEFIDNHADQNNLPTGTIDEYLNTDSDERL